MTPKKGLSLGSALLIVLLIVLWRMGTFDQALVNVGLNAKPCVKNGFGATFCGSSARSYCENLSNANIPSGACSEIAGSNTTQTVTTTATPAAVEPAQSPTEQNEERAREKSEKREEQQGLEDGETSERCEKLLEKRIAEGKGSERAPC